ncbi:hypothetical protein NBH19_19210 [Rhizobium sp. S95]|uniref:Uncharacterized protein n=1 Tax=Ciceribacter sichuanensis TaxID=2949647 RepID=A0AAJ1BXT1_9HYPH|nr:MULTISPECIES: hypothetical protein [unclassified Ciceribacter]MCM2398204.1 hypothetical protein [Ciceribacter sp. S95]MCO5958209.1 hypothetical protein [Ciceribacter sp. S101]
MNQQANLEAWALNRAQQIVLQQGVNLVAAAQRLDRKQTTANTYALRKAIMDSLLEAVAATSSTIQPHSEDIFGAG